MCDTNWTTQNTDYISPTPDQEYYKLNAEKSSLECFPMYKCKTGHNYVQAFPQFMEQIKLSWKHKKEQHSL